MLFLVSDMNVQQEYLMDHKEVLEFLRRDGGKMYTLKDLESDWEFGVTKFLNHIRVRKMA